MKSWKKPTNELIDKALGSFKREHHRKYFFSRLENPLWLKPLAERGCFKYPPKAQRFDDGTVQFPHWPEIQYLRNVCSEMPDEVVKLLIDLPETDNAVVYDGILDIALQLPGKQSAKLKDKMLEYASMEYQLSTHKYGELLAHWTAENQTSAALELAKVLVAFASDPQSVEKQKRRNENSMPWGTLLHPAPRFDLWVYHEIMLKGIRPLIEKASYEVVCLLIDATADMIRLRTHQENLDKEADHSEIWCNLLSESESNHERSEKVLVHTLTFACERVFEKSRNAVVDLDRMLRKQRWKVFKRLRYHLYAKYPNEDTKLWIRESILTHKDYGLCEHHYEFQQMIRRACEHFGETLLTEAERTWIFDKILKGPSKENYRHWLVGWLGEEFTEERFQERQQRFHLSQFTSFTSVLFGGYATYYKTLKDKIKEPISDEDYLSSKVRSGSVSNRSPRAPEDLANLTDEDLLTFINVWEKKDESFKSDSFVSINIEALANAFQNVFEESIIPDPNRLKFWIENRGQIERPIYVRAMLKAMQADVKAKNFDKLDKWLAFSEWVLTHPDQEYEDDHEESDESRERPNWSTARRAVCDFIGTCLEKEIDAPTTAREQLTTLLETLCTQFDWRLDKNKPTVLNQYDPLTEGINNTRSLALQELVIFGFWLREHDSESRVSEVTTILERRFSQETQYPLTPPEYALLGKNYPSICSLNETWATEHKSDFFPQDKLDEWVAAFSSFVLCNGTAKSVFKILQEDFDFALQHLDEIKNRDQAGHETIDIFGDRLFTYYLWETYPLKGADSLLERYYQRTNNSREYWGNLFNHIGHRLQNSGKNLNQNMKDRIIAFFEWRLEQEEPTELKHFTFWLEAECLDAEWRLESYSKILDVYMVEGTEIRLETLCDMLPDHTAKVVECFFKLTKWSKEGNLYIQAEEAKTILKAGLESKDENVRRNANLAHENLLSAGWFDLLNLND